VIIVPAVPLGPSPCWMKRGTMVGSGVEVFMEVCVVNGSGEYTTEFILSAHSCMFIFCRVYNPVVIQVLLESEEVMSVAADESRLVMLPTCDWIWPNPPQLSDC
jgi:hypothetical protein